MQDIVQQERNAMTPCVGSPNVNDVQVIKLLIASTIRKIHIFRSMFGQSLRTVNRISTMSEIDLLKRENGKRNGRWVMLN